MGYHTQLAYFICLIVTNGGDRQVRDLGLKRAPNSPKIYYFASFQDDAGIPRLERWLISASKRHPEAGLLIALVILQTGKVVEDLIGVSDRIVLW